MNTLVNASIPSSLRTTLISFMSESHSHSLDAANDPVSLPYSSSNTAPYLESASLISKSKTSKPKRTMQHRRERIPYNVFLKVRMKEERKKNPRMLSYFQCYSIEITFVELSSQLSKEWKLLSEAEKMVSFILLD